MGLWGQEACGEAHTPADSWSGREGKVREWQFGLESGTRAWGGVGLVSQETPAPSLTQTGIHRQGPRTIWAWVYPSMNWGGPSTPPRILEGLIRYGKQQTPLQMAGAALLVLWAGFQTLALTSSHL